MSGQSPRDHEEAHSQPIPAGATADPRERSKEDRVGHYGGDDGALEHERAEIDASDTLTPDDIGSQSKTGRTTGR
jgi:hypothetical protein